MRAAPRAPILPACPVCGPSSLLGLQDPRRATRACSDACARGSEPDRRGWEDQPGGQLLTAAETTVVTGHRDSNAWRMGAPGNWEAVSLRRRWLWTVSVLGLRLSQRRAQPPPAPRHSSLDPSSRHWRCGVSVFGKAPAFSCHPCCWGTCFGPLCLSFFATLSACFQRPQERKTQEMNLFCSSPGGNRTRWEKCRGTARKMSEWGTGAGGVGRCKCQRAHPDPKALTTGCPAHHTASLASSKGGSGRCCSSGPLVPLNPLPSSPPPVSPTLPPLLVFLEQPSPFLPQDLCASRSCYLQCSSL